jgi:hypothetical protein
VGQDLCDRLRAGQEGDEGEGFLVGGTDQREDLINPSQDGESGVLAVGLGAAFALTRFLEPILFGVAPTDIATFVGVAGLVATVASGACLRPTLRAVRSDPKEILQTG